MSSGEERLWREQRYNAQQAFNARVTEIYVNMTKWRYTFVGVDQKSKEQDIKIAKHMSAGNVFILIVEAIKGDIPELLASAKRIYSELLFDCNFSATDKELLRQCGLHDIVNILPAPRQPPPPPYCPPKR